MRNTEFRIPHSALLLLILSILSIFPTGCSYLKPGESEEIAAAPEPPDYLKIVGIGNAGGAAPAAASGMNFTGQFSGTLRANAAATLDPQVTDPAQRRLMARAEARRKALRALGTVILGQRDAQGNALGDTLKQHPTDQSKLNSLLEEQAQVAFTEEGQGIHAAVTVDGSQVNTALGLAGTRPSPLAAALPPDARKEASYGLALEDAKKKLEQALLELKLADGRTVQQALEEDENAKVDFNALLWVAQPDETRYNPDGSCEVAIFFDKNRVMEIFKNRRSGWQFWK